MFLIVPVKSDLRLEISILMMKNVQPKKINDEELEQFLEENFCRTQSELAQEFGVTRQAISKRLHKLRRIQKEDHWISHKLTAENKRRLYDVAVLLLSRKRKIFCTIL